MAILNRILNIVIFLLAVASLVFGYFLFQKRQVLRDRGNTLASSVSKIVAELDKGSGTSASKEVTDDALAWKVFAEGRQEATLTKALEQAKTIREQRDNLGEQFFALGGKYDIEAEKTKYLQVQDYEEAVKAVVDIASGSRERNQMLVTTISGLGETVGVTVNRGTLDNPASQEDFKAEVDKITVAADALTAYQRDATRALDDIARAVNAENPAGVKKADIQAVAGVVQTISNLQKLEERLATSEAALTELRVERDRLQTQADNGLDTISRLQNQLGQMQTQVEELNRTITGLRNQIAGGGAGSVPGVNHLAGRFIDVNYDWNYVLIDLGSKNNLPAALEMTVARDREYIAKIVVRKVYKDYAVADIVPDLKKGEVLKGDRVFYLN